MCVGWRRPKSANQAKHRRGLALSCPNGSRRGLTAAQVREHAPGHVERHGFTPHLTVARAKSLDVTALLGYKGPWWTSNELVLMRSERTLSGYRYSALDAVLLRGLP